MKATAMRDGDQAGQDGRAHEDTVGPCFQFAPEFFHGECDAGQWLLNAAGDALHAVLCAAGYNLRWAAAAIARMGTKGLSPILLVLLLVLRSLICTRPICSRGLYRPER